MGRLNYKTTKDIKVPERIVDQVIGQEHGIEIIKKAASQRRNVLLIGEPGTGKSMIGQALAELLPKEKLQDILSFDNPQDENIPLVRVVPKGKGTDFVLKAKLQSMSSFRNQNLLIFIAILFISIFPYYLWKNGSITDIIYAASMITGVIFILGFVLIMNLNRKSKQQIRVPKLLIDNSKTKNAPFIDACLLPGQKVFTNPKPRSIENTKGHYIYNADGKKQRVTKVEKIQWKGKIYHIKPRMLFPFTATPNHPFLVLERPKTKQFKNREFNRMKHFKNIIWKSAKNLKEGDMLIYPKLDSLKKYVKIVFNNNLELKGWNKKIIPSIVCDETSADIFGWYLAEGYSGIKNNGGVIGFVLGYHEEKYVRHLKQILEKKFKTKVVVDKHNPRSIELIIYSKTLARWFKEQFGANATSKQIPEIIFASPESVKLSFLRSYIKGDGWETKNSICFATTSRELADDMVFLLSSLGIFPTCYERTTKSSKIKGRIIKASHLYECKITGKQLGKLEKNTGKMQQYFTKNNRHFIPIRKIWMEDYAGPIINMETEDGTYLMPCVTHNTGAHAGALLGDVLHDPLQCFSSKNKIMKNPSEIKINKEVNSLLNKYNENIIKKQDYRAVYLPKKESYVIGEKNGKIRKSGVLSINKHLNKKGELLKITTESGKEILVTPEHKICINKKGRKEYIEANKLKKSQEVFVLD